MPLRYRFVLPLVAVLLPGTAQAQVSIGPDGIRAGSTRIDRSGVHSGAASVTGSGVHARQDRGDATILTNGATRTVNCRGGMLTIDGNRNRLSLIDCAQLTVAGNRNDITARFTAPGRITVAGNRNTVAWQSSPRIRVGIDNVGNDNVIVHR